MTRSVVLLFLLSSPAGAVFTDKDMDAVDTEPLFDEEYFLDLTSFDYPLDWLRVWEASTAAYRVNGASLDRSDLLLDQQVKLPKDLLGWLHAQYLLAQSDDKDLRDFHQWIKLEFGPWSGLSAGIFGEPTFEKEDSDIGALLRWHPGPQAMLYASANAVDFNFNERGRTSQTYDRMPYSYELGGRFHAFEGTFEYDAPLARRVPDSNRLYSYRRSRLQTRWSASAWSAGYSYENKREGDEYIPDPTAKSLSTRRQVHAADLAAEAKLGDRDSLECGGRGLLRRAAPHRRWELQPYGRWRRSLADWAVSEAALFLAFGDKRVSGIYDGIVQAKLGLGLDFLYAKAGRIGLYGTFDIDDVGTHLWDGGDIRAMLLF
ncbi:MAG: hypothetical protein WC728_15310 [Elusimicrobiota bacterium]